jgi:hypothetical protein
MYQGSFRAKSTKNKEANSFESENLVATLEEWKTPQEYSNFQSLHFKKTKNSTQSDHHFEYVMNWNFHEIPNKNATFRLLIGDFVLFEVDSFLRSCGCFSSFVVVSDFGLWDIVVNELCCLEVSELKGSQLIFI